MSHSITTLLLTLLTLLRCQARVGLGTAAHLAAHSCEAVLNDDCDAPSGHYWLTHPNGARQYYCDMDMDGGGWTRVFARRNHTCEALGLRDTLHGCAHSCGASICDARNIDIDVPFEYSVVTGTVEVSARRTLDGFAAQRACDVDGVQLRDSTSALYTFVTAFGQRDFGGPRASYCPCGAGQSLYGAALGAERLQADLRRSRLGDSWSCDARNVSDENWHTLFTTSTACVAPGREPHPLGPSWFTKVTDMPQSQLSIRICRDNAPTDEDIALNDAALFIRSQKHFARACGATEPEPVVINLNRTTGNIQAKPKTTPTIATPITSTPPPSTSTPPPPPPPSSTTIKANVSTTSSLAPSPVATTDLSAAEICDGDRVTFDFRRTTLTQNNDNQTTIAACGLTLILTAPSTLSFDIDNQLGLIIVASLRKRQEIETNLFDNSHSITFACSSKNSSFLLEMLEFESFDPSQDTASVLVPELTPIVIKTQSHTFKKDHSPMPYTKFTVSPVKGQFSLKRLVVRRQIEQLVSQNVPPTTTMATTNSSNWANSSNLFTIWIIVLASMLFCLCLLINYLIFILYRRSKRRAEQTKQGDVHPTNPLNRFDQPAKPIDTYFAAGLSARDAGGSKDTIRFDPRKEYAATTSLQSSEYRSSVFGGTGMDSNEDSSSKKGTSRLGDLESGSFGHFQSTRDLRPAYEPIAQRPIVVDMGTKDKINQSSTSTLDYEPLAERPMTIDSTVDIKI